MKIANISTIKNELSKYLRYVQQGERVRILDRDQAVADLVPIVQDASSSSNAALQKLESNGIIRRGTGKFPKDLWTLSKNASQEANAGVLDAMLKERKEGR